MTDSNTPRVTATASIFDSHGTRYLLITDLEGHKIRRFRITSNGGRGTWAGMHRCLAKAGYKAPHGFKYLQGAGQYRATLIPA